MPKFGDIGQEDSDDEGHVATFMYVGNGVAGPEGLFLDDTDPIDKSLVGLIHVISRHGAKWLGDA